MPLTNTQINDIQQAVKPMLKVLKDELSGDFQKKFDELAAKQLASAKEVDFSNAPVRTDAAVWSDGTEHYIWQDPDGKRTPIDVDYPPIVHPNWVSDGKGSSFPRPDEKEVRAKHNWRLRYLPDQALGNQSFEVIMKEGEQDGADKEITNRPR